MQTKNESIGYILLGALNTSIPANKLKEIAVASLEVVDETTKIDNYKTLDFAEEIGKQIGLNNAEIEEIQGEIQYQFDMKTEEEAADYYESFAGLFPVLKM